VATSFYVSDIDSNHNLLKNELRNRFYNAYIKNKRPPWCTIFGSTGGRFHI
jgi:hypothetical protein